MKTEQTAPSAEVLAAFGLQGVTPRLLADGQGRSWSATSAILRPVEDSAEAEYTAELYAGLNENGFRIPRPLASADGTFIFQGWTAWRFLPGRHDCQGDWQSMLDVCRAFHMALEGLDPPAFLATPRHHWAQADRIAWQEERCGERWNLRDVIEQHLELCDPADRRLPKQLIHGDMAGNLLFEEGLDPGVIDFSPYWRPAAYAMAICVADAIAWYGADRSMLDRAYALGVSDSLLRRACVFRLAAVSASPLRGAADQQFELSAFSNVIALLGRPHPLD
ncbi:MAG: aminoglycoside phosphotransferase [bacterium]